MDQERTHDVFQGMKGWLCTPVLGRGVWAGHAQEHAMAREEGTCYMVVKLSPIGSLQCEDGEGEMGMNERRKIAEYRKSIRFVS